MLEKHHVKKRGWGLAFTRNENEMALGEMMS